MPWFALRLIGLRSALGRAFACATANTARMLAIALCASLGANVWLWRGWSAEQDGRALDRQAYHAAQIEAQRLQDKADWANFTTQTERNTALEKNHAPLEKKHSDALSRYVAANRLPDRIEGAPCIAGETSLHIDPGAAVADASGPVMVAISTTDLKRASAIEVQNTERGAVLNALVEEGLAVPME